MKQYTPSTSPCPIGRASRILGDRWMLLILREAFLGAERFEDFIARLPINRAALTSRLAMMREAGLLERDPPSGKRACYKLTASGNALAPTYAAITEWSSEYLFDESEAPAPWGT